MKLTIIYSKINIIESSVINNLIIYRLINKVNYFKILTEK